MRHIKQIKLMLLIRFYHIIMTMMYILEVVYELVKELVLVTMI